MAVKSVVPPSSERPRSELFRKPLPMMIQRIISEHFDFSTTLLMGALVQGTLLLLIPRVWVLLPTIVVLLARFGKNLAIILNIAPNPYMENSIPGPTTTFIPDREGEFNKEGVAANEKIAVLMLCARIHHPLGFVAPQMSMFGKHTGRMLAELDKEAPDNGFLGQTEWSSKSASGSHNILFISYWRSLEDVLAFSVGPSHKATWAWWNTNVDSLKHIGISHELFEIDRNMYESVYINFQPTGLGATSYFRKGDELIGGTVPDAWVSPLIDASKGKYRTSKGRLGWKNDEKAGMHY